MDLDTYFIVSLPSDSYTKNNCVSVLLYITASNIYVLASANAAKLSVSYKTLILYLKHQRFDGTMSLLVEALFGRTKCTKGKVNLCFFFSYSNPIELLLLNNADHGAGVALKASRNIYCCSYHKILSIFEDFALGIPP